MKKIIIISMFVMGFIGLQAQQIKVKEGNVNFGKVSHNAMITTVYYSDAKTVEKEVKNFMKNYKAKAESKKGYLFGSNLIINSVSDKPMDMYATITQVKGSTDVELCIAFDLGGAFLDSKSHSEKYEAASELVKKMALSITEKKYGDMLKVQEKKVAKVQKDYDNLTKGVDKLEKENSTSRKEIETCKRKIEDNEKKISSNETKIGDLKNNAKDKNKELKEVKDEYDKMKKNAKKIN